MLKTQIKASRVTNLTDARYFAAWGVDWLGFDLEPGSMYHIEPVQVEGIKAWVEGPRIVGEFDMPDTSEVLSRAEMLNLDAIQIGPFFPLSDLEKLSSLEVIQKIVVETDSQIDDLSQLLKERAGQVKHFLLDFSGNNITWALLKAGQYAFQITHLKSWCESHSIFLDIAFSANELDELLALGIRGLSLSGGEEEKVGVKSFDELDAIFDGLAPE